MSRVPGALHGLLVPISVIAVWQLLSASLNFAFLPSPVNVLAALAAELRSGELAWAAAHTLCIALVAAAIATTAGTVVGVVFAAAPGVARWTASSVEMLRTVPAITLIPVAVLTLGPTWGAAIAVATYAALWPMVLNTAGAVSSVHPRRYDVARTFCLTGSATVRKVVLPAAVPMWLAGAKMSLILAFLVTIVVEMVITPTGLGGALMQSLNAAAPERMWVYAFTCGVIGVLLNVALHRVTAAVLPGFTLGEFTPPAIGPVPPAWGLLPLGVLLLIWQACGRPTSLSFPPPAEWFTALAELHADALLLPAVGHTLTVYLVGLSTAAVVGGAVGIAIGSSPPVDAALSPTLAFLAAIPGAALVPVLVLVLGPNQISGVVAVATIASWPILLSTAAVRRAVPVVRVDMSRTIGLSAVRRWGSVMLPSSIPGVMQGIRVTSALALIIALLTDIVGSGEGLGRLLIVSQQRFDAAAVFGLLLVVGAIGYLSNAGLSAATRVMDAGWRRVASAR